MAFNAFVNIMDRLNSNKAGSILSFIDNLDGEYKVTPPMVLGDRVRASGIQKFCPREEAICSKRGLVRNEQIRPQLHRIFKFGRFFEEQFRDKVLGDAGLMIGKWECIGCGNISENPKEPRHTKPKHCSVCGCKEMKYVEEFAMDEASFVGGSTDGFLKWDNDYVLLEMKTANDANFKKYKKDPKDDHVAQAQVYMRLHGYKKTLLVYYNKNNSEYAIHWIVYDPAYATSLFQKGLDVRRFFEEGVMPSRICDKKDCARAKDCAVRDFCFEDQI